MDKRTHRFLTFLKDGRWHRKINVSGMGTGTILACVHLKLIEEKRRPVGKMKGLPDLPDHWAASFKITTNGRRALKTLNGPNSREVTMARHHTTCTSFFCRHRR